jgi:hypothetical protein
MREYRVFLYAILTTDMGMLSWQTIFILVNDLGRAHQRGHNGRNSRFNCGGNTHFAGIDGHIVMNRIAYIGIERMSDERFAA